MKLVRSQLGDVAASVCHERELDAEREVGERLELVVTGWYDAALFPVAAEERRIVANHDNHWDTSAELCQNLVDNPRVITWKPTLMAANGPLRGRSSRASASLRCVYGLGSFMRA